MNIAEVMTKIRKTH